MPKIPDAIKRMRPKGGTVSELVMQAWPHVRIFIFTSPHEVPSGFVIAGASPEEEREIAEALSTGWPEEVRFEKHPEIEIKLDD